MENTIDTNEELMPKSEIKDLNLPTDLIKYLTSSRKLKDRLFRYALLDIEELYLYYSSVYDFSVSAFCDNAIKAISRANNFEKFYFYAKKIMDENLIFVEKLGFEKSTENLIHIKEEKYLKIIDNAQRTLVDLVDKMYSKEIVDILAVHKMLGKIELALELNYDEYLAKLLGASNRVLNDYIKNFSDLDSVIDKSKEENAPLD